MPDYPIQPTRDNYKGKNPALIAKRDAFNLKAQRIADECNRILEETPEGQEVRILWTQISSKLGMSTKEVADIGVAYATSNGITALGVKKSS